jgi:hypothetical protein
MRFAAHRRSRRLMTLAVILLSLFFAGRADAVPLYTVTDFGAAVPVSIDSAGNVVLTSGTNGSYNGIYHSWRENLRDVPPRPRTRSCHRSREAEPRS